MHELIAEVGHELRSPLAAICNALQVLALDGENASTREFVVGLMERQAQCIGRLVNDLMEVSRIEYGKITLRKERLDLAECVARAVETVHSVIDERGHQFEVILPREPVFVNADPGRLDQVLKNLLNNAAKYTDPGGRIWLIAESRGCHVVLRVRDTGIGIEGDMLPHVFESFWQVESALDHSQGGLGIGLSLVRKLVELHGGSVSASSPGRGCGSEFVVRLPLAATPRGQGSAARVDDRPADSPSQVECLARSEMGLAVSQIPIELQGRNSILGSSPFRTMYCNASDDPRCDLVCCDSECDSRPPSELKHGPRAQWQVNNSVK
jgi:signal transduction histidine kinase